MPRVSELLDRESQTVDLNRGAFERLTRRRARRQRNRRIGAGAIAVVVMVVATAVFLRAFRFGATPADRRPTPTEQSAPTDIGDLAYVLNGDVYVADWDGTNAVRIADGRDDCTGGEYSVEGPIWSPDGNHVAYRYTNCGPPPDDWGGVVISDPDGRVIASFPSAGWRIAWSPDSTRVAVWEELVFEKSEATIGIYDIRGVRRALLEVPRWWRPSGDTDPEWLPDGKSILVPGGGSSDAEIPVDGSPPRHLPWGFAIYSPDGSRVAYDNHGLVVANADGSHPQSVSTSRAWFHAIWSPTGDRLAFLKQPGGSLQQLWVYDVATGTVTLAAQAQSVTEYVSAIDFSPDGDWVLFVRGETQGRTSTSLWSVNVDGSDPRLLVDGVDDSADWPQSLKR